MAEPRRARRPGPARPEPEAERRWRPPPPPRADAAALFAIVEAVRRALPRELETQLTALLRELLLTLRSLIDWYLERLDGGPREPEVEEIPIE